MDRSEMLQLWNDMWRDGNWIPSFPDSLAGIDLEAALWTPASSGHCIWQEVVHVTFWRRVTLDGMSGAPAPTAEEAEACQFALPETTDAPAWAVALEALQRTQEEIAAAIEDEAKDVARIPYHLIHDAYHLGRITHLKTMRGTEPPF